MQSLLKEIFPNYTGRIFQVKGQSKNSNTIIFILFFFLSKTIYAINRRLTRVNFLIRIGSKVMDLKHLKYFRQPDCLWNYYNFKVYRGGGHHKQIKHLTSPTWFITQTIKLSDHKI